MAECALIDPLLRVLCLMMHRLCGALTQDMGCAACNAIKCPVCTVWVVADEADAHIDECFEDEEALRRVQMETKAKESRQNKPAAPSSSGKSEQKLR